nr:GH116 family glycosyl hydrolase [Pedobacter panaciterrae]
MKNNDNRRSFIKKVTIGGIGLTAMPSIMMGNEREEKKGTVLSESKASNNFKRSFNGSYSDENLNRIAFPIGGIGAGMFCLEGTGAISHMSVRNNPEMFYEPGMFAAICLKGRENGARVLEGQVPEWKKFGQRDSGLGGVFGPTWGLPRFEETTFNARFPFANIELKDKELPVIVQITGWNPFIPNDEDSSSLPVAGLEYKFKNTGNKTEECVFSYNSRNVISQPDVKNYIKPLKNGFILAVDGTEATPEKQGEFAIYTNEPETVVDHCWFRGGWFDPLTMIWNTVKSGEPKTKEPVERDAPGASLFVPFTLKAGEEKTIRLMMAWYVPNTRAHFGDENPANKDLIEKNPLLKYHKPWYSSKFKNVTEVSTFWDINYQKLKEKTSLFTDTFYKSTLPAEVIEAVAANLTILKSATVLRQYDGRFWCWEGSGDNWGSCHGSCTHVWNYAQAVPHLFPSLERSLRETEFNENQNTEGHQGFRANLPITPLIHNFHSAADGQLGGIMKVYREWRISGDNEWLKKIYPKVKTSIDYCIKTWDPKGKGIVEEPHHNTYDIEFWGPTGFATSFYLGALNAIIAMGSHLKVDVASYKKLYGSGRKYLENDLYDGEYFVQKIQWTGLQAPDPTKVQAFNTKYADESLELLQKEGPKYQYGVGCLSDGVMGGWLSRMCGLGDPIDPVKTKSHLTSVYKYNLKKNLKDHSNPQRSTYAIGDEGGLLLCSWPKGGMLSLPFVYSNEVWTGIEYQVASHLMLMGEVDKGLDIVKTCRERYNGQVRNPFNEYECGHWYARAMSSYGMIESLTGVRYDAVAKTLFVDSKIGDFTSFLSTAYGFGTVSLSKGKVSMDVATGNIPVKSVVLSGKEGKLS